MTLEGYLAPIDDFLVTFFGAAFLVTFLTSFFYWAITFLWAAFLVILEENSDWYTNEDDSAENTKDKDVI